MNTTASGLPTLIVTLCAWTYWAIVAGKSLRRRRRTGGFKGVLPEQGLERVMWVLWLPLVACWLVFPWLGWQRTEGVFALSPAAAGGPWLALRWLGALVAIAALTGSIRSWREMGRNWTMAVTQDETARLITAGMFSRVRHPIYALSITLILATLIATPTWPVAAIALVHVTLMVIKARNEERFLLAVHGDRYASYCRTTGRFFPRVHAVSDAR